MNKWALYERETEWVCEVSSLSDALQGKNAFTSFPIGKPLPTAVTRATCKIGNTAEAGEGERGRGEEEEEEEEEVVEEEEEEEEEQEEVEEEEEEEGGGRGGGGGGGRGGGTAVLTVFDTKVLKVR